MEKRKTVPSCLLALALASGLNPATALAEDASSVDRAESVVTSTDSASMVEKEKASSQLDAQESVGQEAAAPKAPANQQMTINYKWNKKDSKGYYNPQDAGKDFSFRIWYSLRGTDENGKKGTFWTGVQTITGQVGVDQTVAFDLSEVKDQYGKTWTNCTWEAAHWSPLMEDFHTYSVGESYTKTSPFTTEYLLQQNMETSVAMKTADGAIVAPMDLKRLLIGYHVTKDGDTKPLTANSGKNISAEELFENGSTLGLYKKPLFNDAINQNSLSMFNPYNDHKTNYQLNSAFAGSDKEVLEQRYGLSLSGNDLNGWVLTLTSKVKKRPVITKTDIPVPAEIEYVDDPTLDEGVEEVVSEGTAGTSTTTYDEYYLPAVGGEPEKIIEKTEPKTATVDPTKKKVRRGTKPKAPIEDKVAPKPEPMPQLVKPAVSEKPALVSNATEMPKTADNARDWFALASFGFVSSVALALFALRKRRS